MKTSKQFVSVLARRVIIPVPLAIAFVLAPAAGIFAGGSVAGAIPTASAHAGGGSHGGGGHAGGGHGIGPAGPGAGGYGGAGIYRGHDGWWLGQELYGAVQVPHVDTTVHQSR